MRSPKIAARVLDVLEHGPMTAAGLAEALGAPVRSLEHPMHELSRLGAIRSSWVALGRGYGGRRKLWRLAS